MASPSSVFAREFHVGVADAVVSRQGVCSAERLVLGTEVAAHLLLAGVVYRIFMPCKVVGP